MVVYAMMHEGGNAVKKIDYALEAPAEVKLWATYGTAAAQKVPGHKHDNRTMLRGMSRYRTVPVAFRVERSSPMSSMSGASPFFSATVMKKSSRSAPVSLLTP